MFFNGYLVFAVVSLIRRLLRFVFSDNMCVYDESFSYPNRVDFRVNHSVACVCWSSSSLSTTIMVIYVERRPQYQGDVLEAVFGGTSDTKESAGQDIILALVALPGYFVAVAFIGRLGPRLVQVRQDDVATYSWKRSSSRQIG